MDNLELYNRLRAVPNEALKQIQAGRLKGMSDINPMWRIRTMTENFGVCGFGWKYTITKQWTETYGNETKAYCNIDLFVKVDGEWSDAIQGTGGSSEVTMERNGAYVSDECYKMALTDALSVAMKALGVGADIYFEKGKFIYDPSTKYAMQEQRITQASNNTQQTTQQSVRQTVASQYHSTDIQEAMQYLAQCKTKEHMAWVAQTYQPLLSNPQFIQSLSAKRKELGI
jgi:hypothetical protein